VSNNFFSTFDISKVQIETHKKIVYTDTLKHIITNSLVAHVGIIEVLFVINNQCLVTCNGFSCKYSGNPPDK
jgi:hypothetical protein